MAEAPHTNSEPETTAPATALRRVVPIIEAGVVVALFCVLRVGLRGTPFTAWQSSTFGGAPITSTLLFFVLPMVFLLAGRRNPGRYGLAAHDLPYHQRVGLRAAAVLLPVTLLFPVIGVLGTTPKEWPGALILTAGVTIAAALTVRRTSALDTREPRAISPAGTGAYLAMLVLGLLACFAFNLLATMPARAVHLLIFVGFLEEFFFRGYLQSRLNDVFDRPYRLAGVAIGPGLFLSAAVSAHFRPPG